ncbi:hypothetical protein JL720_4988 [Aureococcus anophagefferens]|nr:hypothetical protein JL720_4988 [Aureococcus anophagefferens]
MPPRKRQRNASSSNNFASPNPNRGRVSARLQSLYTGDSRPGDGVDYVRASRHLKARRWEKRDKVFGGPGPQAFTVVRWQPVGPANAELQALRDRPPPSPGDAESGESTADLFNELAARHAEDSAAAAA